MNTVQLVGNLCRDNEIRYSSGENATAMLRNTIAVQRRFKDKQTGNYESDFISIQAFGSQAEFINKFFAKGSKIGITGHIQTGSYTNKDGVKVYTTDVMVDTAEFVTSKGDNPASGSASASAPAPQANDFINEGLDDSLPWK